MPGENRVAAALDLARTVVRRAERDVGRGDAWRVARDNSQVVPYLNRLADLVYTLARWQEGGGRPARSALTARPPSDRPRSEEHPWPSPFSLTSSPPSAVKADLLAVPVFADGELGPGARTSTTRSAAAWPTSWPRPTSTGKRGETLAVPTTARSARGPSCSSAWARATSCHADALRRAGAALARRATKVRPSRRRLLDAAPAETDAEAPRRRWPKASCSAATSSSRYKADAKPSTLGARARRRRRRRQGPRRARARRDRRRRGRRWARDLVNEPAGAKSPADIVDAAQASSCAARASR